MLIVQKKLKKYFVFFFILLDQLSKIFVLNLFPQIVVYNKGIAFGFLASEWWLAINLIIVGIVILLCHSGSGQLAEIESIGKILIIGGGISNILDRLFRGVVVDFIDLGVFPIFNLADVFICLGIGIMILLFCDRTRDYFSGQ